MGAKSKYIIVQLKSIISGTTKVWVRERAAGKFSGVFFDPAIGQKVKYEESSSIKSKPDVTKNTKRIYMLD